MANQKVSSTFGGGSFLSGWQEKGFWFQFGVYAVAYVLVFLVGGFLVWAALAATS